MKNANLLRRYTDLPILLHLLKTQNMTLLDPEKWDDKNDAFFLTTYKKKKNLASVLALCFTEAEETYHHWKVFAPGTSGVCIRIKKDEFLESIHRVRKLRHRIVDYRTLEEMETIAPKLEELPFIKRYGFRDEQEYRLIYECPTDKMKSFDIPFQASMIARVVLSPWMPKPIVASTKKIIQEVSGIPKLKVFQTTLNENERWKSVGENIAPQEPSY